ncbi:MAG: tRNA pseudouridine(13) synthase TruD [Gammaproteobacteria bacterium]|nr:tRNA pseudouridine(13) synthase TruD [Gammaproteobacteria bacterium]
MRCEEPAAPRWLDLALNPPYAHGGPPVRAVLRAVPEDFEVEELLGFEPDGGTAHVLLRVEKRAANTLFVARRLAAVARLSVAEVGFAGLKDRHALVRQWFSLPARAGVPAAGFRGDGFTVLGAYPHSRKLHRGALAGNRFRLLLREVDGDLALLAARLGAVERCGVPNYFGPQRFGRAGANLARVEAWLAGAALPAGREPRAFLFSAARALVFNAVLAVRVAAGNWDRLLAGEVVSLAGSRSVFVAEQPDAELERRCAGGDLHPSGPLGGADGVQPRAAAAALEQAALAPLGALPEQLGAAGLRAERRALRLSPRAFGQRWTADGLELTFELPRGGFATALLRELVSAEVGFRDDD